jgi:hypothetical protein
VVDVHPEIILYALRYALGRQSYAVHDVARAVRGAMYTATPQWRMKAIGELEVHLQLSIRPAMDGQRRPPEPSDITDEWLDLLEDLRSVAMYNEDDEGIGTIRWFGPNWGAPINSEHTQVPVPVGTDCSHCGRPITAGEQGVTIPLAEIAPELARPRRLAQHLDCHLTTIGLRIARETLEEGGDGAHR